MSVMKTGKKPSLFYTKHVKLQVKTMKTLWQSKIQENTHKKITYNLKVWSHIYSQTTSICGRIVIFKTIEKVLRDHPLDNWKQKENKYKEYCRLKEFR